MKNDNYKNTTEEKSGLLTDGQEAHIDAEELLISEICEVEGGATECVSCSFVCYAGKPL